ncbi:MAG: class I SAM-dependent methyltransferase [Myxococcota bacterium]
MPADLEALYSREYFEGKRATGYPSYLAETELIADNFDVRLRWIERLAPPGRLLDVGAAYGLLLARAVQRGWDAMGVEIAADCAAEAQHIAGVPVVVGDFATVELPSGFDVITMFDVIEHMRDPLVTLRRAATLLTPGGLLVVETADAASLWARLLGRYWYFLDPPQHLFYFTAAGLESTARESGFGAVAGVARPGRRVSLANIAFKLAHSAPAPLRRLTPMLARLPGSVPLNFGDGLLMAFRKA